MIFKNNWCSMLWWIYIFLYLYGFRLFTLFSSFVGGLHVDRPLVVSRSRGAGWWQGRGVGHPDTDGKFPKARPPLSGGNAKWNFTPSSGIGSPWETFHRISHYSWRSSLDWRLIRLQELLIRVYIVKIFILYTWTRKESVLHPPNTTMYFI